MSRLELMYPLGTLTRQEVVKGYDLVEKAKDRRYRVEGMRVVETLMDDGRIKVEFFRGSRLVERRFKAPGAVVEAQQFRHPMAVRLA